jgi:hypothetical protein
LRARRSQAFRLGPRLNSIIAPGAACRERGRIGGASLAKRRSIHGQRPAAGVYNSCTANRRYLLKRLMIDALETRLIETLKSVDAHGDVAPAHVRDPMTMLLRIQAHLVRWDDVRGRYVLTGTGRRRIGAGCLAPGTVVSFQKARCREHRFAAPGTREPQGIAVRAALLDCAPCTSI